MGFQYRGKDKRGVSRWRGNQKTTTLVGNIFTGYGAVAGTAAAIMLLYALFTLSWPLLFNPLFAVALIHAVTFGSIGVWATRMQRHIVSLSTQDELSTRFEVPRAALEQTALARGIKPRMSINDVDYYNPADFAGDALTLLRGASEPVVTANVLLRPASGTQDSTQPNQLLRAAQDEPAEQVQAEAVPASYMSAERYNTEPAVQQTTQAGQ